MTIYTFNNLTPNIKADAFIAPTAQIIGDVHIGAESSVWFSAVIRGDMERIRIGSRTNVQDLCTGHADPGIPLTIGDGVTIGHRCVVHGCTIEDECLIGMGAIVMNRAVIGTGSIVAAGSVVLENTIVPPYSLVTGAPGKIRETRRSKEELTASMAEMAESYIHNTRLYRSPGSFYPVDET